MDRISCVIVVVEKIRLNMFISVDFYLQVKLSVYCQLHDNDINCTIHKINENLNFYTSCKI